MVGLGALGIVTRVTLDGEPYYEVSQRVFEELTWEALFEHFDEITAAGESVSVFHRFGAGTEQVWVKTPRRPWRGRHHAEELFGARPALAPRHPIPGSDPVNCTEQLGVPGPWSERLPHFRSGFTPSAGEEIQSEFFVAREHAMAALGALRQLAGADTPAAADLRAAHHGRRRAVAEPPVPARTGRSSLHLEARAGGGRERDARDGGGAGTVLAPDPLGQGVHCASGRSGPRYERFEDFRRLRDGSIPARAFVNHWLRSRVLEDP